MIAMGIDFGGSGIKGALVDCSNGELVSDRLRIPTPHGAHPEDVAEIFQEIIRKNQWSGSIGIAFPAVIRNDIALNAANISKKWIGLNVAELVKARTGCDVRVINDADAAGLAEMTFGAGKGYSNKIVLMLTIGTGIGSSIFVNGHLLPNTEFGHLSIRSKDAEKRISDVNRRNKKLTWKKWSYKFQEFLSEMEKLINPDVIIIGGGVSKYHHEFSRFLKTTAEIHPAFFLNKAGIIGSALFACQRK
jgi:polyphosphate glucokinase